MTRGPHVGQALMGENGEHISGQSSACLDTEFEAESSYAPGIMLPSQRRDSPFRISCRRAGGARIGLALSLKS